MILELPELRIWLKEDKKMILPEFGTYHDKTLHIDFYGLNSWEYVEDVLDVDDKENPEVPENKRVICDNENSIVMRNADCFDKKMHTVFEGDVAVVDGGSPFVVEYENGVFNLSSAKRKLDKDSGLEKLFNLEVLGNVWENPEIKPLVL